VKLLLDEHFSFRIADQLRKGGFDVVAVVERAELCRLSDEDLLRWAHGDGRALVTENVQDLLPIHGRFLNHEEGHSGLVLTTARRFPRSTAGIGTLVAALGKLLQERPDNQALCSDVHWL